MCENEDPLLRAADNHAYRLVPRARTWLEAGASCQALGGHLATLEASDENAFLLGAIPGEVWIGGSDGAAEGAFQWVTGAGFAWGAWAAGEPNDGGAAANEDCVTLRGDGTWNDSACGRLLAYLCEVE